MDSSDPAADVTRDDLQHLFSQSEEAATPFTTTEVAESLECSPNAVERDLETLAAAGELATKELAGERVWWQPPEQADPDDRQAELQEFGAFVSAVKDYAIFMLDPDGTVASWNQGAKRIKGYSEEEIIGRHFSTFYTDEDVEDGVPETNLEKAAEAGRVEDEGWRVRQDGTQFWADVIITAIRGIDGTLKGFTKVTRDMTEQREYELQLRKERDLTTQILETVPVGISVIDSNKQFVRANQEALDILGITKADLPDRSIESSDLYDADGDTVPIEDRPWTRVIDTGDPVYDYQCQLGLSDAGPTWISINAVPLEDTLPDDNGIVLSIEDITDQKTRERQLEQRKTELETELSDILGRISDAFFALDDEWQFTHLNEDAAELFQYSRTELMGRSLWDVFPDRSVGELRDRFHEAMDRQETMNFELYDDEFDAWLEFNVYPSESGVSVYFHDISGRKEYQQKLEESNERLEQFAYAASHDLQEPLRMVSSYLQLIERRYGDELDDDGREFLEFAVDGADRMRHMIEGLLEYSRVEAGGEQFEPVALDDVLDDVRDDLQVKIAANDAEITAESLPRVEGDANQLRQVFQNLVDNAIEYAGDDPPRVHVGAERDGDRWLISVRDNGIGIDPDDRERIFGVFQRLHTEDDYDGTGIGLALCERIVERHGGDIWVDSEPGDGSTFSLLLPADGEGNE